MSNRLNVEDYMKGRTTEPASKEKGIVIHNVYILDKSGSMQGKKYEVATAGILEDLSGMLKTQEQEGVTFTNTLIFFSGYNQIQDLIWMKRFPVGHLKFPEANGATALNKAVYETIKRLQDVIKDGEKVLIKVFTDGEENDSHNGKVKFTPQMVKDLIERVEQEGFTITFTGTKKEVDFAITNYGMHINNTMVHNNTLESVRSAFSSNIGATKLYTKKLKKGISVTDNFYTDDSNDSTKSATNKTKTK